ncbi:MAG: hypothetical protein JO129_03560 [Candidatus Dependentiae bacterium]|nr:hypothetical protein [Candidatus Dependentiae bacterium]
MKRYLFFLLLLTFNPITTTDDQRNQKKSSFYNSYFIVKEFSNFCITYRYYLDQEKIEKSKIVCNQCDYIVGYRHLCCYYIFEIEEAKLKNIFDQMKNASSDELKSLLLNSYEEPCIPCDQCKEYHGWHIETSDKIIQDEKENAQFERAKQKLYATYFAIKEFCKMNIHEYFIDNKKINDASIYCSKCNQKSDAHWLWISLIFKCNQNSISELQNFIYNKSTKDLALHTLQKHQELELYCAYCGEYNGYYIPQQSAPQD